MANTLVTLRQFSTEEIPFFDDLSGKHKRALHIYLNERLSVDQIGKKLGITRSAVSAMLCRALSESLVIQMESERG